MDIKEVDTKINLKTLFYTQHFNKPPRDFTHPGEVEEAVYASRFDKKGNVELYVESKRNNDLEIQSHRDACDLSMLLARYEAGDTNALNQRTSMYIDTVNMPKNAVEMLNVMSNAEQNFYKLPLGLREMFGNSLSQFIAAMDNPHEFEKKLNTFGKTSQQKASASVELEKESEVKAE